MNTQELNEAERAIEEAHPLPGNPFKGEGSKEERNAVRAVRDAKLAAIRAEWVAWLGEEYASDLPQSVRERIYAKAWELGHGSGYGDVQYYYEELSDFARLARNA